MNPYITSQNDLFIYFEVIRQLRAKSVLDLGPTLKRGGAVSRQVADSSLSLDIRLTGVDLFPEIDAPVYNTVYDRILSLKEFSDTASTLPHDTLTTALCLPELPLPVDTMMPLLKNHSDYILISMASKKHFFPYFSEKKARSIQNGENTYLLIKTGD